jgi:ribonuclease HI
MAYVGNFNHSMSKKTKKYYAVRSGRELGIYLTWEECKAQVDGYPNAEYKGFSALRDAEVYLGSVKAPEPSKSKPSDAQPSGAPKSKRKTKPEQIKLPATERLETSDGLKQVVIYTDGACTGNPGPGGYGVVLLHGEHRKELSGGFRLTTNNRMEILACLVGLRRLKVPCAVTIYSDSKYVVNTMTKAWALRWRRNGWKRKDENGEWKDALNADLWAEMLDLCDKHRVEFAWVRGHAGNRENERCDQLAREAAWAGNLAIDHAYEHPPSRPNQ